MRFKKWTLLCLLPTLIIIWVSGVFFADKINQEKALHVLRWIHNDPNMGDIVDIFTTEYNGTESDLIAKYIKEAHQNNFRGVHIGKKVPPHHRLHRPNYTITVGGSSNGSGFSRYISPISAQHFILIRTQPDPKKTTKGMIQICCKSYLFGIHF